jgi:hypothetical protein
VGDVLGRSDVSMSMTRARRALARMSAQITTAFAATAALGQVSVGRLGGTPATDTTYLKALTDRWEVSSATVLASLDERLTAAFGKVDVPPGTTSNYAAALGQVRADRAGEVFDSVTSNLAFRLSTGISSAVTRGYNEAVHGMFTAVDGDWYKVWHSRNDEKTCQWCRAMDGQVAVLQHEFVPADGLDSFGDLQMPPAHPHCRCWIEVTQNPLTAVAESQPAAPGQSSGNVPVKVSSKRIKDLAVGAFNTLVSQLSALVKALFRGGSGSA